MKVTELLKSLFALDGDFCVQVVEKETGRNLAYLYRDRDLLVSDEIGELKIIGGGVKDSVITAYVSAPKQEKEKPAYESRAFACKLLRDFYEELQKREKPERSQVGGTYYGSTELLSSVGNHLDWIEDGEYTSYYYGGRTTYVDFIGVRVGGAYKVSGELGALKDKLTPVIKEIRELEDSNRISVVYDHGTNYSVIGFGVAN